MVIFYLKLIAKTEKLAFMNEVDSINAEAERLKAQGVDIIIVLSHCGLNVDRKIAAKCPNVDRSIIKGKKNYFEQKIDKIFVFAIIINLLNKN